MKEEILEVLWDIINDGKQPDIAYKELCVLFDVSQQSELYCFECEIEMPTKVDNKSVLRCGNCGLKH